MKPTVNRVYLLSVYRRLFEQLAAEDNEHIDNSADRCYPTFGNSKSDYEEEVAHFYGFWMDFSKRERDKRVMAYRQVREERRQLQAQKTEDRQIVSGKFDSSLSTCKTIRRTTSTRKIICWIYAK
ncbi:hypothetical protein QR680_000420 [Steinernema hermaphroditum]|uniref:Uncharacterized protein n=1 Tax=Steinernema hermaphroditum TaxID=289476 RepID=A0AA39GXA9_9BILA|nr:hypothetical protein QR680_000420 [Steinernema hermaphroditum]